MSATTVNVPRDQRGGDITAGGASATLNVLWPTSDEGWRLWRTRRANWRLAIAAWALTHAGVDFHPRREAVKLIRQLGLDLGTEERLLAENATARKRRKR